SCWRSLSSFSRFSPGLEIERVDAGREGRTSLPRQNSQARTETQRKKQYFSFLS
ncbi:unnamed protein product, partial [Ascophyllum nodosum]